MATGNNKRGAFEWAKFWSALSTMTLVTIIAGVGFGLAFGMGPLEHKAAAVIGAKAPTVTISWPPLAAAKEDATLERPVPAPGTWLDEQFRNELLNRATRSLGSDAALSESFDRAPLEAVGQAMRTSGWFVGTPSVTRRPEGEIHVEGTWRIPAAVVRCDGRDRLVSWDALPMPVDYLSGRAGLTVILGVAQGPARQNGAIDFLSDWPGEDLRAGLELLALLARQPWASQVAAIDVSSFSRSRQLEIRSIHGGRIVWGGRPSKPLPGEGATSSKVAWLDYLARERRSIDAGLKAVDISGTQPLEIDVTATGGRQ
jgi:hypothetical protein